MDLFGDLPPLSAQLENKQEGIFEGLEPPSTNKEGNGRGDVGSLKRQTDDSQGSENEGHIIKRPKTDLFQLKGYMAERQGEREEMQDAHVIINDVFSRQFIPSLPKKIQRIAYYGVFDGHGGLRASKFTSENLHNNIFTKLPKGVASYGGSPNYDKEVRKCLTESFKKTDEDFLALAAKSTPTWKDGTTVAVLLVIDNVIFSANLGDSRAYVCRRDADSKVTCIPLTKDHNPLNFEERKRIEKNGGIVRDGRVMGIVEVSRSIGDGRFKHCGVTAIPDIFKCQITDDDIFFLLACDGLWKVFTANEATQMILNIIEDGTLKLSKDEEINTNYVSGDINDRDFRFVTACNRLAVEAVKRGCTDNVTVMIVDITPVSL